MDDHEVEIVYDVKLAFQNGKLYAAEVDFSHYRALRRLGLRKLAKLLTNRNKENRVSWLYVQPLPQQLGSFAGNIKLKVPKAGSSEIHPVDLADILEELEGGQRVALFNALDAEQASDTLEEVEPRVQRELIRRHRERARGALDQRNDSRPGRRHPRDSAARPGRWDFEAARSREIVEGRAHHRRARRADSALRIAGAHQIAGHDAGRRGARPLSRTRDRQGRRDVRLRHRCSGSLKGVVDIREIVAAEPGQTLGDIMTEHVIALPKDATLREAGMLFERYDFRALPITDESDQLLGAVSSRDVRALRPRLP